LTYNTTEALYLIIYRDASAERKLREWARSSSHNAFHVEGNRMKIFDRYTYDRFCTTWNNGWDEVIIWDVWNRRHIYC
jgi:hypothetical protein